MNNRSDIRYQTHTTAEIAFALHSARRASERATWHRYSVEAALHAGLVSAASAVAIIDVTLLMKGLH